MAERLNKAKAAKLIDQASRLLAKQPAEALAIAERLIDGFPSPTAHALKSEALLKLGKRADAEAAADQGLKAFPGDPTLLSWKGAEWVKSSRAKEGRALLEQAHAKLSKEPTFLLNYALALSATGEAEKAENSARKAFEYGAGPKAKLVLAMMLGRRGQYTEAVQILESMERQALPAELIAQVKALRADLLLFMGSVTEATALWSALDAAGNLGASALAHFAYGAQLAGDPTLADALIARRSENATPEDLLLFALIALARGDAAKALETSTRARTTEGIKLPDFEYEVSAAEGRALRLLGRVDEATAKLEAAAALPQYHSRRLGPRVRVDRSHLAAEAGDFDTAIAWLEEAKKLDEHDPEVERALQLARTRVAWKTQLTQDTSARVEAAQAEAEAMRRHFVSRESELEQIRRELERVTANRARLEARVEQAEASAKEREAAIREEERQRVHELIALRESEADQHAKDNLERALGGWAASCPPELRKGLEVAEQTFQRALFTELPATSVALLFSGALERWLFFLYVRRFDTWLEQGDRRAGFLEGAVRERRGAKVEYYDHFVQAFDLELRGKVPTLGEMGRVLEKRGERYLAPFQAFLQEHYAAPDSFYEALAVFVRWSKEKLRDPAAHGLLQVTYGELRTFREQLMFAFAGGKGALVQMGEPKTP